jgi:hypothetical protein
MSTRRNSCRQRSAERSALPISSSTHCPALHRSAVRFLVAAGQPSPTGPANARVWSTVRPAARSRPSTSTPAPGEGRVKSLAPFPLRHRSPRVFHVPKMHARVDEVFAPRRFAP